MKIGIIGGTSLGKTLGRKFLDVGINVVFGVRSEFDTNDPEWKILNDFYDKLCSYQSAMEQSDIVIVCCENQYLSEIATLLKTLDLTDKLLIDTTNSQYHHQLQNENTTLLQSALDGSPVFKAFNNLGLDYPSSDPLGVIKETYFCGENSQEKNKIKRLIEVIGFKAIDAGSIENAPLLEAFYHLSKEISQLQREESNCHFKLITV